MERETVAVFGVAIAIGALFGAIFVIGMQPPEQSGSVIEPPSVDVPPELIESIRDDPPPPRFSERPSPDWPDMPENERLTPPEPGPDDKMEPPEENPQGCIEMEFVDPPSNVTAGEAFTLKFHEWSRTPDYQGNVINFIFITGANSSDVMAQVPLQYGEPPFRYVDIELSDGDGYAFGPVLDLSKDGRSLLGYTWTPRQSTEWWMPIDMSILEPGEYVVSMAAYDATTCVRVAKDIAISLDVTEPTAQEELYFTNVTANGLDVEMGANTTYGFDITADATPKYLQLLNDSLRQEPNGTSCHLNENDTVFSWRLDLEGAEVSDLRYSHFLRGYFVGDPANEMYPGTRTPEPINGGVRLTLGSAPMAHAYSAYGMGQQYWDCNTTFNDAEPWNATMEGAIYFTTPGTYVGELYIVGPDGKDASERLTVRITVATGPDAENGVPGQDDGAPDTPNEMPAPPGPTVPNDTPPTPPGPVRPNDTPVPSETPEQPRETPPSDPEPDLSTSEDDPNRSEPPSNEDVEGESPQGNSTD